jgi:pyruvate dehydrogenase E2 component (dihydrolipoamide acetyltransferase)
MATEITMPQLSDTMTEGTVVKWHKKEGDKVREGDKIADVETDKAVMEMESFESGTISRILVKEGEKVQVGAALAIVGGPDEKSPPAGAPKRAESAPAAAPTKSAAPKPERPAPQRPAPNRPDAGTDGASAHDTEMGSAPIEDGRAQSRRESVLDDPEHSSEAISREASEFISKSRGTAASARTGIAEAPEAGHAEHGSDGGRLRVSPLARRTAAEKNVDLGQVTGSGPGGRIIQRDILGFTSPQQAPADAGGARAPAKGTAAKPMPAGLVPQRVSVAAKQVIPLSKIRGVIAQRLQQSKQQIPHFYETVDIDVESLTQLREHVNKTLEPTGIRLSIGDFVAKAVAVALTRHQAVNAHFNGTEITQFADVNLGMAVALESGLIVPVLRGINYMGLAEIRVRSADLVERARAQRLKQEELSGATFTVSNLGSYGVREFSAIINPPEVGILAIGSAQKRAVVKDDQLVARSTLTVTLSADHRAVDGSTAAEFLRTLRSLLEEPAMMLV